MAKPKVEIIKEIDGYMQKFQYRNTDWYVGIASDPHARLFNDHNVDEQKGVWIYEQATSTATARAVEQAYLARGMTEVLVVVMKTPYMSMHT